MGFPLKYGHSSIVSYGSSIGSSNDNSKLATVLHYISFVLYTSFVIAPRTFCVRGFIRIIRVLFRVCHYLGAGPCHKRS